MATKKTQPDPGVSRSFFLDDDAFVQEVDRASGWTSTELKQLLSKSIVPDHWNGTPTVALLEAIRYRIELSHKSYEGCFPTVFKALHIQPTPNLFILLRALKKHVTKAKNTGDSLCLTQEFPCLRPSSPSIGLQCTKNGITPLSLLKGSSCKLSSSITNAMILEMHDYRAKNHVPWQKVVQVWWKALFKTKSPSPDMIQSNWMSLNKTRQELRNEALRDFLRKPYTEPGQEPVAGAEPKAKKQSGDVHAVEKIPPPQKRRGQTLPQNMAITLQYLTANFKALPERSSDLKNGHLLFLHSDNNLSIPKTIDIVGEKLSCRFSHAQLESLVNRANELRSADYDAVMSRYKSLCCDPVYTAIQGDSSKDPQLSPELPRGSPNGTKETTQQRSRQPKDTIASMTPTPKTKKVASSLPCEVFFACTRCGSRSRTVPQLHTHYRTVHKEEIANGTLTSKDPGDSSQKDGDTTKLLGKKSRQGDSASSKVNEKAKTEDKEERLNPDGQSANGNRVDMKENSESDVVYVEGSQTPASTVRPGPVINHPEKDCVITRKRNVPLGMLEGKKNSLMVIFQHSDQNKPLPEGSSFKLRNTGGEQTYLVVANVDVDIIEQGRPVKKAKTVK